MVLMSLGTVQGDDILLLYDDNPSIMVAQSIIWAGPHLCVGSLQKLLCPTRDMHLIFLLNGD